MQLTDQQWAQLHESVEAACTQDGYVLTFAEFNAAVQRGIDLATASHVPSCTFPNHLCNCQKCGQIEI